MGSQNIIITGASLGVGEELTLHLSAQARAIVSIHKSMTHAPHLMTRLPFAVP